MDWYCFVSIGSVWWICSLIYYILKLTESFFSIVIVILGLLFVFVVFPLIFMNSIKLQQMLMFTNFNLPSEQNYFRKYELMPGLRNIYVSVKDLKSDIIISLGVWHLLPYSLHDSVITEQHFDFDRALKLTNSCVILYFHGTGEDRSTALSKYTIFRYFSHVITFDYRNYGDSTRGELSEDAVVSDCVQLYKWLITKTDAPIFLWGHSLGTALAAKTALLLQTNHNISKPVGLVLEAPFTKMSEELYVHPYGKIFAWLPWFEITVVKPLEKNGFLFDNSKYITSIDYPIMILSSEDDSIVPYKFGRQLYAIGMNRVLVNTTLYYQFPHFLGHNHNFIYRDPFLPSFINYFSHICMDGNQNHTK